MPVGRSKSGFRRVFNQHGIKTVKNLAGDSPTPLTTAGKKYSESGNWAATIKGHYANLLKKY